MRTAKQVKKITKQCPRCGEESLKRERRPGHWLWRCWTANCGYKREGKSHD